MVCKGRSPRRSRSCSTRRKHRIRLGAGDLKGWNFMEFPQTTWEPWQSGKGNLQHVSTCYDATWKIFKFPATNYGIMELWHYVVFMFNILPT